MIRLLMNPTPDAGGGPPPPTPAPTPAPDADPIKALLAEKAAEARALKEQLDGFARLQAEKEAESERARLKLLAEKEGAEKALEEQRQAWERKAAEAEAKAHQAAERHLSAEKTRVIAESLSSLTWLEGGLETAAKLIAPLLDAKFGPDGTAVVVCKATGLPASQVIAEMLGKPPYTHLIAAPSKGGSGATAAPPAGQAAQQQLGSNPVEAALATAWVGRTARQDGVPGFGPRSFVSR
jgi:hypothetical protein